MAELKLKANQAALILEASEEGEISVNVRKRGQVCRWLLKSGARVNGRRDPFFVTPFFHKVMHLGFLLID